jgi:hypothetical protein
MSPGFNMLLWSLCTCHIEIRKTRVFRTFFARGNRPHPLPVMVKRILLRSWGHCQIHFNFDLSTNTKSIDNGLIRRFNPVLLGRSPGFWTETYLFKLENRDWNFCRFLYKKCISEFDWKRATTHILVDREMKSWNWQFPLQLNSEYSDKIEWESNFLQTFKCNSH